jgi:hypothetical protein
MTHTTQPIYLSPLTPDQGEALVRLLAKACKAGFLPSFSDLGVLIELIPPLEVEAGEGGAR